MPAAASVGAIVCCAELIASRRADAVVVDHTGAVFRHNAGAGAGAGVIVCDRQNVIRENHGLTEVGHAVTLITTFSIE